MDENCSTLIFGILPTVVSIVGWVVLYFLQKRTISYQKKVDIAFQQKEIEKEIIFRRIEQGDKVRVRIFQELYSLFFQVLYLSAERDPANIGTGKQVWMPKQKELFLISKSIREEIFSNSIWLGGDLAVLMLQSQIAIDNAIFDGNMKQNGVDVSQSLTVIEEWIQKSMKTNISASSFFSSSAESKELKEMQNKVMR